MKDNLIARIAVFAIACVIALSSLAACNGNGTSSKSDLGSASTASVDKNSTGLWKNAKYKEDTEIGIGAKTVKVEVKANDGAVTFTIHTDADTLGKALLDNKLVEGDNGEFGLYIKKVNGIAADYNKDKAYWALSKDGAYSETGADSINIADGEHYELTYTK